MPTEEKKQIVETWFMEAFTKGDLSVIDRIASKDMITYSQGHDEGFKGRENFKNWLAWYCESFVDRNWIVHDIIEEGDKVVTRYTGHSIYKGGLLDIPSTDQNVKETGIIIFRVNDGKVVEQWCEMSDLQVVQQLGAKIEVNF
ncbi:ester cyclase [Virgibacillus ihumii]|uniref:ester cyclase n=1 Tax=Virgibacillus ihumii TaxID=2686091 RepID=UPI00157BD936|nr:ester cyclase [Virgibacillus ihumii]